MRRTLPAAWPWLALALVGLLALGNAWRYGTWIANPLVHSDSWYFLDAFVEPWAEGALGWQEFFIKRDSSDHAQPLHRASLWLNLEWADLDFRFEAVIGLVGMSLCMLLLCLLAWLHLRRHAHPDASARAVSAPLLLLPVMALSLNSHEIYYWSLVAFFHVSLLPALVLMAFVCWQFVDGAGLRWKLPLAFLLSVLVQVALDGAGTLVVAALLPTLAWAGWRHRQWRLAAALALSVIAGLWVYRLLYSGLMPPVASSQAGGVLDALGWLWSHADEAWRWLSLPAAASLVQPAHLPFWLPEAWLAPVQNGLGVLVVIAHAVFWWSQSRARQPAPLSLFASSLMLLSYGMLAGILLSRVPVHGSDYVLQSRYVAFYQLANLALLLQLLVAVARLSAPRPAVMSALAMLLLSGLGLQVLLSARAWEQGVHIRQYSRNMASNLVCVGEHPGQMAPVCQPGNVICQGAPEYRDRLFALLRTHRLNLYAPGFLDRHGLDEGLNPSSCLVTP